MNRSQTIVVAGASSGIGRAVAQRFLDGGWDVAVLARRGDRLEAWRAQATERTLAVACDLTDPGAVMAAATRLATWRPRLHALVASAGDFTVAPLSKTTPEEFERVWRVNVVSKFLLLRALQDQLRGEAGDPGAAILVASLAAHHDFPDETAYMSAMHAVRGLARAADAELRGQGIRVATLSPGLTRTPLTERSFPAETLAVAMPPEAMAESAWHLVQTLRRGEYIPDLLHLNPSTR